MTTGSPLASFPPAWEGFWDQSQDMYGARMFANANLASSEHWYALGYPLLGVPFLTLFPRDPFFLVNMVSLIVFALAFLAVLPAAHRLDGNHERVSCGAAAAGER